MIETIDIDGADYRIETLKKVSAPLDAPRLLVVSYLPNPLAAEILKACIRSIQQFTTTSHELWIIDNHSPAGQAEFLRDLPGINVVFNYTTPSPEHLDPALKRILNRVKRRGRPGKFGSYANGIALEIGARSIDHGSKYCMTLHMDTMPVHPNWLDFLINKLDGQTRAAGVRLDTARVPEGILHVLGYVFDFSLFEPLKLSFLPDLPRYDVGDRLIIDLKRAGYKIFSCRNTLWDPSLIDLIPASSPFYAMPVDRSFDDSDNVIFLHLGRGVVKSSAGSSQIIEDWLKLAPQHE